MATFNSAFYLTQVATRVNTSRQADANIASGDIEVAQFSYTLAGTEAAADIINLGILPAQAIVVPALCSVFSADPGTTLTVDVGYAANPDAYADGLVLSAGGHVDFTASTPAPSGLVPEAMTTGPLLVTVASAATLTAAVVLHFTIAYKRPKG